MDAISEAPKTGALAIAELMSVQPVVTLSPMMAATVELASNPAVDIEKFKALVELQRDMQAQQAEAAYNRAMAQAQAEMEPITRDARNDHTRSKYARLERIDASIRPIYTHHGFALSSNSEPITNGVRVLTEVTHRDGHKKIHKLEGALDTSGAKGASNKTDIQGLGSSITYLRRYLTIMIFNLALTDEDIDGNSPVDNTAIDAATVTLIKELLVKADANEAAFLDYMGAPSVEDIRAKDKAKAVNGLMAKLKKAAAVAQEPTQ